MSWNHRVLKHIDEERAVNGEPTIWFAVHEVHYEGRDMQDFKNILWSENASDILGDTFEEMVEYHQMIDKAFDLPILVIKNGKLIGEDKPMR